MLRIKLLLVALGLIISGPYLMVTRYQADLARSKVLSHGISSTAVIYGGYHSGKGPLAEGQTFLAVRYRANDLTQQMRIPVSQAFFDQHSANHMGLLEIKYLPDNPSFGVFPADRSPYLSMIIVGGLMLLSGIIAWIIGWRMNDD